MKDLKSFLKEYFKVEIEKIGVIIFFCENLMEIVIIGLDVREYRIFLKNGSGLFFGN